MGKDNLSAIIEQYKILKQAAKLPNLGHLGYDLTQRVERRPANRGIQQRNRMYHGDRMPRMRIVSFTVRE